MHVELSEEHSPSHLEPADDFRILGWNAILEDIAGSRGANARGVHQVLERNRDSMERAFPASAIDFGFRGARLRQCGIRCDQDEGVQLGVELFDSGETCFGQLDRGDLLGSYQFRRRSQGERREICGPSRFPGGRFGKCGDSRE